MADAAGTFDIIMIDRVVENAGAIHAFVYNIPATEEVPEKVVFQNLQPGIAFVAEDQFALHFKKPQQQAVFYARYRAASQQAKDGTFRAVKLKPAEETQLDKAS